MFTVNTEEPLSAVTSGVFRSTAFSRPVLWGKCTHCSYSAKHCQKPLSLHHS